MVGRETTYCGVNVSVPCIMSSINIIELSMKAMEKTPQDIVDWRSGLLDEDLRCVAGEGNTSRSMAESLCKAGEGAEDKGGVAERDFKSE